MREAKGRLDLVVLKPTVAHEKLLLINCRAIRWALEIARDYRSTTTTQLQVRFLSAQSIGLSW